MSRSVLLAAALFATLLLLLLAPDADAGTYVVRQCQHPAPTNETHEGLAQTSPPAGPYTVLADSNICASAAAGYAINISPNANALTGQYGIVRFRAPTGTTFTRVSLDARLRSEQGHRARLSLANAAGVEKVRFATGASGPADFTHYNWPPAAGGGYEQFTAALVCDNAPFDCPITNNGDKSSADIRNIRFDVTDSAPPTASVDGPLVEGGWIRGTQRVAYL